MLGKILRRSIQMASDSREIQIMRAICWERAKGELGALIQSYWEKGDR